jgi:hypothetical protein
VIGWPNAARLAPVALATFGILALELALIRWMSGQIRLFKYFNNLILIGCFLGMGLGLAVARRRPGLVHLVLPTLLALSVPLALADTLGIAALPFPDPSVYLWGAETSVRTAGEFLGTFTLIVALFCGVVAVFGCAGAALGELLSRAPSIPAYSADLVGSILGIVAMTVATMAGATPPVWLALGALPFAWLSRRASSWAALAAVVVLGQLSVKDAVFSPYNRIELTTTEFGLTLSVNGDFHQYMHDLSDTAVAARPEKKEQVRHLYDLPFILKDGCERALVVGAGTGNDVQGALRNRCASVTSVDIDGRIMEIGRRQHPERPYDDARVVAVVNDARAFFEQYRGPPFDVVCYGFLDSQAMFSALSSLRLENYLYTEAGFRSAWRHVAPGGHMSVHISVAGGPWLLERFHWTIARATGAPPVVIAHGLHRGVTFVAARDPERLHWERVAFPLMAPSATTARHTRTTSDDWPFLFVRPGAVPWGYLLTLAVVLLIAGVGATLAFGRRELAGGFDPVLFLMGAAFLLLETRGVTSLSLLFGSTWVVNAAVFGGVLIMALAANVAVQRGARVPTRTGFALLLVAVLVLALVEVSALNRLALVWRGLLGGLLNALPVGFAGLVLSGLLARTSNLSAALGSNLLGSVVGGCLEYLSMYTGLRALALLALALYLMALLVHMRREEGAAAAAPAVPQAPPAEPAR